MIPPRAILAAVDFSDSSRVALAFAARLARQAGATLHVLHAEDPLIVAAAKAAGVELATETREELKQFVAPAVGAAGNPPVHYHVVGGAGTPAICHAAARERADLVVMGMHGMSGAARAVFGSTTDGVLRQAETSILAVPDTWTPPRPEAPDLSGVGPVVAAIEGSQPSMESAAAACRLAALLDTSVELVHIVPDTPVLSRWRAHAAVAVAQRLQDATRELTALLPTLEARVPVQLHVRVGQVAEGIADAVAPQDNRSPLLVLGRRGQANRLGPPGATAYRVLSLARVPVLVHLPEA